MGRGIPKFGGWHCYAHYGAFGRSKVGEFSETDNSNYKLKYSFLKMLFGWSKAYGFESFLVEFC